MGSTCTSNSSQLLLKITTGETQSQELFDFQQQSTKSIQKKITSPIYIVGFMNGIQLSQEMSSTHEILFKLQPNLHQLIVSVQDQKQLWRVIRQHEQHPIYVGTQIKIGKVKLILKEIHSNDLQMMQREQTCRDHLDHSQYSQNKQQECRICFDTTNNLANPLLNLCKCAGSVRYTHYECLKDWIVNNVEKKIYSRSLSYSYYESKCQICRSSYHNDFIHEGKCYQLLELQKPEPPYAIFQGSQDNNGQDKFIVYMLSLIQGEQLIIGRNNTSSMVMKDISVSRTHCSVTYKNNQLFIQDKNSKFGTLIRAKQSIQFNTSTGLQLQYESNIIEINSDKKIMDCCCSEIDHHLVRIKSIEEIQSQ